MDIFLPYVVIPAVILVVIFLYRSLHKDEAQKMHLTDKNRDTKKEMNPIKWIK